MHTPRHALAAFKAAHSDDNTNDQTNRLRVLICEDDDDFAVLSEFLLRAEGFDIAQAEDAETARTLVYSEHFDCMILDLGLPGIDGLAFLAELERSRIDIPVIVISANATKTRQSLGRQPEFVVDWIDKPVQQQQLVERVLLGVQPSALTGRRVLHVEDDPDIVSLVQVMLDDTWEVITAADLAQARERLLDEYFDLVLLDINLPDGSGLELLPEIRSLGYPVAAFAEQQPGNDAFDAFDATIIKSQTTRASLLKTLLDLTEAA